MEKHLRVSDQNETMTSLRSSCGNETCIDFGPPEGNGPIRSPLYVCLSVCMYVCMWHPPSLNHSKKFPEIWHEGRGPLTKKSDRARFWGKNRNWGFFALFFNIPPFCRVICFAGLKNSMGHVILRRKWLSKCFLIDWGQARCWGFTSVTSHSLSTLRRISLMIESASDSEMIS